MRCEEFDPKEYCGSLIRIAREKYRGERAEEVCLHLANCEKDRKRFESYLKDNRDLSEQQMRFVLQGLEMIKEELEEFILGH
ncbi:hypothetical protein HYV50_04210 [Candidatus Pacearchaeota archaeon]|nr:hypothetical protein [Candidatus Pacearchaeota archaeon]